MSGFFRVLKIFVLLTLIFLVFSHVSFSDSLWNENSSSPYTTQKTYKVGDIINVLILESTSAIQEAGTQTHVRDELGLKFDYTLQGADSRTTSRNKADFDAENKYRGIGKTSRSSNVRARVASVVKEVLPGGKLQIEGKHVVDVNREKQTVIIKGVVRSKDINIDNTVFSYQVADAEIIVKGSGVVGEAEQPGWLTRFFNWLF